MSFVDPSGTGGPQLKARHVKDDGDDILERDEDVPAPKIAPPVFFSVPAPPMAPPPPPPPAPTRPSRPAQRGGGGVNIMRSQSMSTADRFISAPPKFKPPPPPPPAAIEITELPPEPPAPKLPSQSTTAVSTTDKSKRHFIHQVPNTLQIM